MGVIEREDILEKLRDNYADSLRKVLKNSNKNKQKLLDEMHSAGVKYFNAFERTLDEYSLEVIQLSEDVINRKIEDTINIIDSICNHWRVVKEYSAKNNLIPPPPSPTIYASIQRVIKRFNPSSITAIKAKFIEVGLPTYGFDDKKKHSGWKNKKTNMRWQIGIGLILLISTGILSFKFHTLTGMQYIYLKGLMSLGISLLGEALLEGKVNLNWTLRKSLVITAVGWVAIFVLLYFFNPPPTNQL
jgi:hypothetical protein